MTISRFAPYVAALILAALTPLSFAQYVWTDEKGVKQFSDMPPPVNVPKSRILKQPNSTATATATATTPSERPAPPDATKTPLTTAEKNADFNKRRMEQAEKDKKAAQQADREAAIAKNCERAREYSRLLQSGQRIVSANASGEREFMSDERRAQELREAQQMLNDCK